MQNLSETRVKHPDSLTNLKKKVPMEIFRSEKTTTRKKITTPLDLNHLFT